MLERYAQGARTLFYKIKFSPNDCRTVNRQFGENCFHNSPGGIILKL